LGKAEATDELEKLEKDWNSFLSKYKPHAMRNIKKIFIKGLVGICVALGLFVALSGFILKQGISFNNLTVGNISISQCTLIWKDKLELQIDTLKIGKVARTKRVKSDISYKKNDTSYDLSLITEYTNFQSHLTFERDALVIDIIEAANKRFNSRFTGRIRLDAREDNSKGTISALINENFPVTIDIVADSDQFSFEGREASRILEIKSLVDLFGLDNDIQVWITEYLTGSRYHLKSFKGHFPWDTPEVILDTLEAEVRVDDTEYTFAPGLEPIKAEYTDVFFTNGVLEIRPHNKTFYGQDGGDSWLDINFNDPDNIILTAYIQTHAVLNDDILTLLNYYEIPLPFKQVGGTTETDLSLAINLNTEEVETEGTFNINQGLVLYDDTVFTVSGARILLVNADVTLDRLKVGFDDLFVAQVNGTIQAEKGIGDLNISLEKLNLKFGDSILSLDESAPALQASYHFNALENVLDAGASSWKLDSIGFKLGPFSAPLFMEDFSMELPPVLLDIPPGERAEISGFFSIKKKKADITYNILKYHVKDLELIDPPLSVDVSYDKELVFRTKETANFSLSNIPITVYPSEFRLDDEFLKIAKSRISYGSFFDSKLKGAFNYQLNEGTFYLKKINITHQHLDKIQLVSDDTIVEVSSGGGNFVVICPELDLKISSDKDKNWSASFGDLSTIYSRSRLLQEYKIKEGSLTISSENGSRPYMFSADITSPYSLLIDGDEKVEKLSIDGKLTDEGVTATVNEHLRIDYDDKQLRVTSNNFGFDISELIRLIRDRPQSTGNDQDKDDDISTLFTAENTLLYLSPNSRILADHIELEYLDNALKMNLSHGPGSILVEMNLEDEIFLVEGSNLNDLFMGAFIQRSKFEDGQMSLAAKGTFDEFSVLFEIKNTVLANLKTLNNVMALLNTVPAFVTFSAPEYNSTGLPLTSALVGMKFKNRVATFESMDFKSPSLSGAGVGWIDFSQNLMELNINLTTQRKENIRKFPVAGYILHGEKGEPSMTVKIKGSVDDPDVTHTLFKEIISKPFKVLVRILKLPFHIVQKMRSKHERDKQTDPAVD
jgi:hypothetical protein